MPASRFVIEQVTGSRRMIVLKGRALPYRPVAWGGTGRVNMKYYAGNPVAQTQVIGPTFKPTELTGTWKDRFLFTNNEGEGVDLIRFPAISSAGQPQAGVVAGTTFIGNGVIDASQPARLARTVRSAFELIRSEMQKCRVQWEDIVRYGFITDDEFRYGEPTGGIEDIGWTVQWTWSGKVDAQPIPRRNKYNALGNASGLQTILDGINSLFNNPLFSSLNKLFTAITQTITQLLALVAAVISGLQRFTSISLAPIDLINTVKGNLRTIQLLVRKLLAGFEFTRSAAAGEARQGDPTAVANANLAQMLLRDKLRELGAFAEAQERSLDQSLGSEILGVVVATPTTTLRDVAYRYYGDANRWLEIAAYNSFLTSVVPAGVSIRVPRL